MEIGTVRLVNIENEMRQSYLDYSMSVIVQRALPDVRDGMKPVQRRVLYSMHEMGLRRNGRHRKSAGIVGEVMKNYHPHGDSSIYGALAHLVQPWSMRYPLIDGQGNFGSVDGDLPAAMRYTEARMAEITEELLRDIDKNTVEYRTNYDDSMREPTVLPARLPALLLNGAAGIAVGMATNIPPHNLREICDAITFLIDHPEGTLEQLLEIVQGPDFPTGGTILGREGIKQAYATGRGRVVIRAKAFIEEAARNNRFQIIVTELPFQVNKSTLIERMASLVKEGTIDGISDLRDESDRNGMRIVIELKREAQPRKVLNSLFKHTAMQSTFGVNTLALVDGKQPRVLTLKRTIQYFIEHRQDVIRRRSIFELEKARQRAHILEGLRIALDHIDEVISTIRASRTTESARNNLMKAYQLSESQANAILDIRLARLAQLERRKIDDEYKEILQQIKGLETLLADEQKVLAVIKEDMIYLREKYGDDRRTVIREGDGEISDEDLIPEINVLLTLTNKGYVKRLPDDTYRTQHRGGRGVSGLTMREEDDVQHIISCNTMDTLLFFTNQGRCYSLKAHEIPDASRTAKGTPIVNLLTLQPDEVVTMPMAVKDFSGASYLVLATRKGKIKRTPLSQFAQVRANGLIALGIDEGDELAWVRMSKGDQDVIVVTAQGKSIRFGETDARPMGRQAAGVTAIRLAAGDVVVGMDIVEPGRDLVFVSANGFGKRTPIDDYPRQGRGGSGVIAMRVTDKTGLLVGARMATVEDNLMMITQKGIVIRIQGEQISRIGRATQGVTLMKVGKSDRLVSMALVDSTQNNGEDGVADLEALEVVAQAD
ncbi:MAG: DNA gyrase subunit A [uncultured Thermomicrobiales bacterium]|uniref:DNA gyrase subunit A n=1 Tax=uncultured Thermomicrobiales bacterium TaxID=1645740 RepID=A0A6J4V1S7_9BACT|nr:MAG: DNA gyrase subunit A [uncultured Thermomicrobiales bacterium]